VASDADHISPHCSKYRPGLFHVCRVEPLSEPAVDFSQQFLEHSSAPSDQGTIRRDLCFISKSNPMTLGHFPWHDRPACHAERSEASGHRAPSLRSG
jgi:hypothetical protein